MSVTIKKDNFVATIILFRPEAANALSTLLAEQLTAAIQQASANPEIRTIILTGAGERAFSAGADLKERQGMNESQWHAQHHALESALHAIISCEKPIIAAVNGAAFGGGFELALACDFIHATETAKFAFTEATLGIMPGMSGTQTLARAVGTRRASEIIFSGKPVTAQEGLTYGFINRICNFDETLKAAHTISMNAPLAINAIKKSINSAIHLPLVEALKLELSQYNKLLDTNDRREGITAWNEKRKPEFKGN